MRSSPARCWDKATEQGATTSPASLHRRPTLYLASVRRADGRVVTFESPDTPRVCAAGTLQDTEERQYGKLGETVYEKKTVVTFTDPLHPSVFETRFNFETFGRLLRFTYPDGEILTDVYDSGGNLLSTHGDKNGFHYNYLKRLSYDRFEQRVLVEAGNSVKTAYTYDAKTRRLNTLTAGSGTLFQNLQYSYDKVGNILSLQNQVAVPPASSFGGPTTQAFTYDELYRLTDAQGTFQTAPSKTHTYAMDLAYDTIHNIVSKHQLHTIVQPSATAITQKKTSYDFAYQYNPPGLTSVRPHAPTHIGDRTYSYDLNGNQTGWTQDTNGTNRTIIWNEENRIESVADNGQTKTYKYDDQGTRTIKRGPQGETVYVNQFYTQRPGATATKHVYAGTGRIVSKLVKQDIPGANPQGNTPFEKDLFFYHPDHLGSSNYITNTNGKIYEHLEYFPFGETWVEENSNTQRTPFLFTAKELDEETGLYYYGARYYDPRTSVWQSADPAIGKYLPDLLDKKQLEKNWNSERDLPGLGGVFTSVNINLYAYSHQRPTTYIDPDGKVVYIGGHVASSPLGLATSPPSYHITIVLIPNRPQDFKDRTGWTAVANDRIYATLGGQPFGKASWTEGPLGNLKNAPNYSGDALPKLNFLQLVETPKGMTDTQFIDNLIKAAGSYQNDLNYDLFPAATTGGYNSNSYVSGVLRAAGATPPPLRTGDAFQSPGYDKPIPLPSADSNGHGATGTWGRGATGEW